MTRSDTHAPLEELLREAMAERAAALPPTRPPLVLNSANSVRADAAPPRPRRGVTLAATLATAAAVVAVTIGGVSLIGGSGPGETVRPAATGPSPTPAGDTAPEPGPAEVRPGGDIVTPLGTPVTVTESGTQTVELGAPPAGVSAIEIRLTCLTAGSFTFEGGASVLCGVSDLGTPSAESSYRTTADATTRGTTITAGSDDRWSATITYVNVTTTPWGVNDRGQTYGVDNDSGTPDLIAAIATNGLEGYVLRTDLDEPSPATPGQAATTQPASRTIDVYESDGTTRIGEFLITAGDGGDSIGGNG